MKIYRISAAALMFLLCFAAAEADTMTGMVTEVYENGYTLYTFEGEHFAAVSADTAFETDRLPYTGDVITVYYDEADGQDIFADTVICRMIRGTVETIEEADEPYLILMPEDEPDAVRVNLGTFPTHIAAPGMPVTVYYNGMQTRSVPPQITADYIRGYELRGTVAGLCGDDGILLIKDDGEMVLLHVSDASFVTAETETGKRVRVSVLPQMRLSVPAQYEVQDILPIDEKEEDK